MTRRPRHRRCAFTIIELLVVISIIALLIAILLPSAREARYIARRTVCTTRAHQWSAIMLTSAMDNNGRLRSCGNKFGGWYPSLVWITKAQGEPGQQWSQELLAEYMPGVDFKTKTFSNVWYCPMLDYEEQAKIDPAWWPGGWTHTPYALTTGVDRWSGWGTARARRELTATNVGNNRGDAVIVSDVMYKWTYGGWWYNHGENGQSIHWPGSGSRVQVDYGPPALLGTSRGYVDGSARWIGDENEFDAVRMQWETTISPSNVNATLGWVRGGARDTTFY
ncbi:MAG: prepilin-type N-terminal cleavage/methylation domain-containing protein [Phycisphaera sp.]|nr:prepilin-type N-terminal cleavage/methylation domain-containing protein [Phycisphaera sp.]